MKLGRYYTYNGKTWIALKTTAQRAVLITGSPKGGEHRVHVDLSLFGTIVLEAPDATIWDTIPKSN